MNEFIQFAVLGLGAGAVYALVAQGIVLIYRASGILNFAQGAMAMSGAFLFFELTSRHGWSNWPALVVAVAALALVGALVYQLVMRPLRRASPLARVIATLGVLTILQSIATIRYSASSFFIVSWLPTRTLSLPGNILAPEDRLWLLAIVVGLTGVLHVFARRSRFGLATTAVAENQRAASSLGWSPDRLGVVNWAIGAALAGLAGILITPLTSLSADSITWIVVPAMAAALIGGFTSFPVTLLGGLGVGILQSEATNYISSPGAPDALPFLVIILVLVLRGRSLPLRSHLLDRLPALGTGNFRYRAAGAATVVVGVLIFTLPDNWVVALTVSIVTAIILLSIVVLTGYAGQLSLAQYTLAGAGALFAAQLIIHQHVPFEVALVVGVISAVLLGVVFGLPALRARGINLAIVTLGLGLAFQHVVFNNENYAGGYSGLVVGNQSFFGIHLNATLYPRSYALLSLAFLLVATWAVCNLRRGRAGRRLIAVRTNERAAASLGVSVFKAKLYAFALSAGLAGLGGILLSFMSTALYFTGFNPVASITSVLLAIVGGVGFASGPFYASTLATGGFPGGVITQQVGNGAQWLVLIGGVIVLLVLIQDPDGIASSNSRMVNSMLGRFRHAPASIAAPTVRPSTGQRAHVAPSVLELSGLTVRFGGVSALRDVSFSVRTGEVVGLIGPNGAGKTTLIDAVSGFVRLSAGSVVLGGRRIDNWAPHRRARAGITRSFQSLELFDDVSVLDNVRAGSDARDDKAFVVNLVAPGSAHLTPAAQAAVEAFDLERDLHRRPEELSAGRRRLVAIARAVAMAPSFLLLDEPVAGMGDVESSEVGRIIRTLAHERGLGILLIEHDVSVVMNTCDRVVVLDFGEKIAEGLPGDIRTDRKVVAAYLGVQPDEGEPPGPSTGPGLAQSGATNVGDR